MADRDKYGNYINDEGVVIKINTNEKSNVIYDYIYDNIVDYCVEQIELGNYKKAYDRYKNSILSLEEQFLKTFSKKKIKKSH